MSPVEKAYSEYIKTEYRLEIGGNVYYKIVFKECFCLTQIGNVLSIVLPNELFSNSQSNVIEDENGDRFELIGPEHIRFDGEVPEWYMQCVTFMIQGISDVGQIGDCVKAVESCQKEK